MIGVSLIRLYIFGFPKKFIPFATAALLILTACTASFAAVSQAPPTPDIHRIADIFEPLSRPAELLLEPTHLVFLTNRANHTLIGPFKTGIFLGNCVEYCGTQHANMFMRAIVQTPEDFQKWMDNQKRLSAEPQDGIAVQEKKDFYDLSCVSWHKIDTTPAAGVAANTPENLHVCLDEPNSLKPGFYMPALRG